MTRSAQTTDMAPEQVQIELRGLSKSYDSTVGVNRVDVTINKGEFFSLLGPSGCGKSTILKMIAGFEVPSEGEVIVAGRAMTGIRPEHRNIGFVFQNYAVFPHMNVFENVAFGLRARGVGKAETRERVEGALELVELPGLGHRRPNQLSGGQQQRVALARALVIGPDVLLLDEPLGALDKKLRQSMQIKLVELQRTLGVTTVFVTHDQEEALTMSDRIAVMSARRQTIEQVGTPREIYEHPASVVVSEFIGQTNLWKEQVSEVRSNGEIVTRRGFRISAGREVIAGETFLVSVRPERIQILSETDTSATFANTLDGRIREVIFVGETIVYLVEVDLDLDVTIQVKELNTDERALFKRGDRVRLVWRAESMRSLSQS